MKNKFILFTISAACFFSIFAFGVSAQTATATPTASDLQQKAQKLLELVASNAARLNLTEKRGIIGTVTDTGATQITVDDAQGNTRFIDVDELTKFKDPNAKGTFGISDIKKGSTIGALGLYNKSSRRLLARFVDVVTLPTLIHGTVASVNSTKFNFDVMTDENKRMNIDVETVTKTNSYTLSDGLVKSGFSKITNGENVVIIGYPDKTEANKIVSSLIILFPQIPKNPTINIPGQNSSGAVTPPSNPATASTGSGKALTPKTN
ncbi:MAG: hypothetical protein HYU48_00765 [Candidatus Levybacteria bacterium]|nr:hypothetical protein [Candidatus Levybacteria bacterium]